MGQKVTGTVKWFNASKGYGFITPKNGGNDVFLHYTALDGQGYKTIEEGAEVEFAIVDGSKGPQAANVVKI